jgi:hypothetical protein
MFLPDVVSPLEAHSRDERLYYMLYAIDFILDILLLRLCPHVFHIDVIGPLEAHGSDE